MLFRFLFRFLILDCAYHVGWAGFDSVVARVKVDTQLLITINIDMFVGMVHTAMRPLDPENKAAWLHHRHDSDPDHFLFQLADGVEVIALVDLIDLRGVEAWLGCYSLAEIWIADDFDCGGGLLVIDPCTDFHPPVQLKWYALP